MKKKEYRTFATSCICSRDMFDAAIFFAMLDGSGSSMSFDSQLDS